MHSDNTFPINSRLFCNCRLIFAFVQGHQASKYYSMQSKCIVEHHVDRGIYWEEEHEWHFGE